MLFRSIEISLVLDFGKGLPHVREEEEPRPTFERFLHQLKQKIRSDRALRMQKRKRFGRLDLETPETEQITDVLRIDPRLNPGQNAGFVQFGRFFIERFEKPPIQNPFDLDEINLNLKIL